MAYNDDTKPLVVCVLCVSCVWSDRWKTYVSIGYDMCSCPFNLFLVITFDMPCNGNKDKLLLFCKFVNRIMLTIHVNIMEMSNVIS